MLRILILLGNFASCHREIKTNAMKISHSLRRLLIFLLLFFSLRSQRNRNRNRNRYSTN